jgi:hypothetical protein
MGRLRWRAPHPVVGVASFCFYGEGPGASLTDRYQDAGLVMFACGRAAMDEKNRGHVLPVELSCLRRGNIVVLKSLFKV